MQLWASQIGSMFLCHLVDQTLSQGSSSRAGGNMWLKGGGDIHHCQCCSEVHVTRTNEFTPSSSAWEHCSEEMETVAVLPRISFLLHACLKYFPFAFKRPHMRTKRQKFLQISCLRQLTLELSSYRLSNHHTSSLYSVTLSVYCFCYTRQVSSFFPYLSLIATC